MRSHVGIHAGGNQSPPPAFRTRPHLALLDIRAFGRHAKRIYRKEDRSALLIEANRGNRGCHVAIFKVAQQKGPPQSVSSRTGDGPNALRRVFELRSSAGRLNYHRPSRATASPNRSPSPLPPGYNRGMQGQNIWLDLL